MKSATVSALLLLAFMLALQVTFGTADSADADAFRWTAQMNPYTPFTTPKVALASALRIPIMLALQITTSIISLANASVPPPIVLQATTSTPERAHASQNTVLAPSVTTGTF